MRGFRADVAAAVLAVLCVGSSLGHATSFNPLSSDECTEAELAPGARVFLFHSGTEETRRAIRAGDELVVFRSLTHGGQKSVGRIRVDAAAGELCFRGVVLEGELRPHDLVRASSVTCLVISTDAPCYREDGR